MDSAALFRYLDSLAANNDRAWFAEHRAEFDRLRAEFMDDLQRMINEMAKADPSLKYLHAPDCVYRIYRDIRFSHDKSPFKTFFSASISPYGRKTARPCWYLHVGSELSALYGGLWEPEPKVLKKIRKAIVDNVEEFREVTETPEIEAVYPGWYGRKLKTAPQGYPKDHPDIDLLRLTEYGKECDLDRSFFARPDWPEQAARKALLLKPMIDFLNYSIDE